MNDNANLVRKLITGSYAGTRIEAWSPPETLAACGIEDYVDEKHPWHRCDLELEL